MGNFNLLNREWIPAQCADGTKKHIAPYQVTQDLEQNPVARVDAPRDDMNGALLEFLVGLFQTAMSPETVDDWMDRRSEPPPPEQIRKQLGHHEEYFELLGDGPRFMQDQGLADGKGNEESIARLALDAPGENGVKKHTDWFQHDEELAEQLCCACSAALLYSHQAYATFGGAGYRTSLRGGGPITTLVDGDSLWEKIWNNMLCGEEFGGFQAGYEPEKVYSWLTNVKTSEEESIFPEDRPALHTFWSMPRRIFLQTSEEKRKCDLCGQQAEPTCIGFRKKNYGQNYEGSWQHPLTPYRYDGDDLISQKPNDAGLTYQRWDEFALPNRDDKEPALVVQAFYDKFERLYFDETKPPTRPRMHSFGYNFNKATARNWQSRRLPLLRQRPDDQEANTTIQALLDTADDIKRFLIRCVQNAEYGQYQDGRWIIDRPNQDEGPYRDIGLNFYRRTNDHFFTALRSLESDTSVETTKKQWLERVCSETQNLFDEEVVQGPLDRSEAIAYNQLRGFVQPQNETLHETLKMDGEVDE